MEELEEILSFLKENKPYYLATIDGYQARLRPIGTSNLFEGKLYFQTSRDKDMYEQLKASPRIEIVAFDGNRWLRITAHAQEDERIEALDALMKNYPRLREKYAGDDSATVFYLDINSAYYDSNSPDSKETLIP